jgi:hypothetical protein
VPQHALGRRELDRFAEIDAFGDDGLTGGDATGGNINIQAGVGGQLTAGVIYANADGYGGPGDVGGNGTGGKALAQSITGGTLTVDSLNLTAGGYGGTGYEGGGGDGLGGKVVASADAAPRSQRAPARVRRTRTRRARSSAT